MEKKINLEKIFLVLFWGNFIPLQGIEYIVRAAKKLTDDSNIRFEIIGNGQTYNRITAEVEKIKAKNISFIGRLPLEKLPSFIRKADICLGIFGNTEKATRVIPNKVYEAIAMKKPVISGNTLAIRELFTDRENISLCKMADSKDLAKKILELKNDAVLRDKIAHGGYKLFTKKATPKIITRELLEKFKRKKYYENYLFDDPYQS